MDVIRIKILLFYDNVNSTKYSEMHAKCELLALQVKIRIRVQRKIRCPGTSISIWRIIRKLREPDDAVAGALSSGTISAIF